MPCAIPSDVVEKTIAFHGHSCPGLAIGVRAAELALREFGDPAECDLAVVSETDMCGADAIQFITGCTFGKGNFMHRDYGKMAFSFYDRKNGRAVRALLRPGVRTGMDEELGRLMGKENSGEATEEDLQRLDALRNALLERFMTLELDDMFTLTPLEVRAPRRARVLASLVCDRCGESTMESRTRRFGGETLCIPCFAAVEQKI